MYRPLRIVLTGLVAAATLSSPALAQTAGAAYPSKAIRFILPFPPGSGTDIGARILAQQVSIQTGQPVVVDNRAGGNGLIAAQAVAQAPADGYTVFVTTMTTQAVNLSLYKKLPTTPPRTCAGHLAEQVADAADRARTPDAPKSVAELGAHPARPGKINFASGNMSRGSAPRCTARSSAAKSCTSCRARRRRSSMSSAARSISCSRPVARGAAGQERAAARARCYRQPPRGQPARCAHHGRSRRAGRSGRVVGSLRAAGTPRPVIDRLNKLMHTAMSSREYQEQAVKSGTEPTPMSPEQFGEFVRSEVENWARAVKASGIQPE
jgi:hypothetical protein